MHRKKHTGWLVNRPSLKSKGQQGLVAREFVSTCIAIHFGSGAQAEPSFVKASFSPQAAETHTQETLGTIQGMTHVSLADAADVLHFTWKDVVSERQRQYSAL